MSEARIYTGTESVKDVLTRAQVMDLLQQQLLSNPETQIRIRSGQRKLIFALSGRIGLRDEQLHDLIEWASGERTRAISRLTMAEARRLIGLLKRMEHPNPSIGARA